MATAIRLILRKVVNAILTATQNVRQEYHIGTARNLTKLALMMVMGRCSKSIKQLSRISIRVRVSIKLSAILPFSFAK